MNQRHVILTFPKSIVDRPIISQLARERGVEVNILQAHITPEHDGRMFAILQAPESAVDDAINYLVDLGVRVVLPVQNLVWNRDLCVDCGACVGPCPSQAFTVNPSTRETEFHPELCIACDLCIPTCAYGALESISTHLQRTGEL